MQSKGRAEGGGGCARVLIEGLSNQAPPLLVEAVAREVELLHAVVQAKECRYRLHSLRMRQRRRRISLPLEHRAVGKGEPPCSLDAFPFARRRPVEGEKSKVGCRGAQLGRGRGGSGEQS